jgi:hypothetical protein
MGHVMAESKIGRSWVRCLVLSEPDSYPPQDEIVGSGYSARDCTARRYADEKHSQGESHQGEMARQF